MNRDHANERALLEIVDVLARYRWRFVLPAFATLVVVLLGSLLLPKKYEARGLFERQQDVVLSEMGNGGATDSYQNSSLVQIKAIASEPAVDQLLRRLRPELERIDGYRSPADLERLRRNVMAKVLVQSDLSSRDLERVRVEYTDDHPMVASLVVNGLIEQYIAEARAEMDRQLLGTRDFFLREVKRYQRDIEALEDELLRFEIENAELLPENPNSVQAQVQRLELQLEELRGEKDAADLGLAGIRDALLGTPETVPSLRKAKNPEVIRGEAELRALEARRHEYLTVYKMKPAHPDLQTVEQQIAEARQAILDAEPEVVVGREIVPNPQRRELELRLGEAESARQATLHRIEAVRAQLAEIGESLAEVLPVRTRARRLERDVEQARRQLGFWEERLRRVQLSLTAEDGDRGLRLNFIRPARASAQPVSPRMSPVALVAVLMSMVVGSLSVFFAYRTDDSFNSGHRLAAETQLPLMGAVSELVTRRFQRRRRLRQMILYPVNAAAMIAVLVAVTLVVHEDLEKPGGRAWRGEAAAPATDTRADDAADRGSPDRAPGPLADARLTRGDRD